METVKKITLDLYNKNIVSINAKQYDDKTRYVEITTVEDGVIFNIDKTKMSAFLRLKKPDNKGVFNEVEITSEGKMRIELTQQILATPGRAVADIMLFNTIFSSEEKPTNIENINEINAPIISIMNFYINITPTALDHSLIESSNEFNALTNALSKVDYNNKLINENEKIRQANEEIRKSNESIRIDNENTRKQNEINRINEENARIQQESIRKTNEQNRITTENTRVSNENKRESNESTRKSNESQRQTNETNRTSSEDKRISAETDRQFNETTRQDNEDIRKSNENSRISNETTRSNSENERIKNENTRISNETTRQAQENKRQTDSATAITNANNAAKNANDKANDLQNKLDNNYFVLTNELENSVSSTSTTHAPTANAVKTAYDKAVSVENTINSNKNNWNDKYTKNEIDNKFSTLENNIDWKESVNTFADIAKTYPKPEDGWTVNVKDTDYTYRYSGDKWVAISANAIPKATQSVDGLLSKEDKVNYDDANSKKHTHSNKSALDSITSALIATWNKVTDKLDKTGDASNTTNSITIATNRENLTTGEKLSVSLGKIKKWFTDLKNVAFTGSYNDLSDKPTSMAANGGNSSTVNGHTVNSDVPANAKFTDTNTWRPQPDWNATSGDAVIKNKPSSLPASDVYSWAKASTKPSYSWSEITSKPSTFTPASHTHDYAGSSSAGGAANSLAGFINTTTSTTAIDNAITNGHVYVNNTSGIYSQNDGAAFVQAYSSSWVAQIYQDYRTGQIALRGKNNGTWQDWRKVLDSSNYTTWAAPKSHSHSYTDLTNKPTIPTNTNQLTNGAGYITGITKAMVTNALGYTPPISDTNTWRGIQNNLTSDSTTDSLSAAQGKALKTLVDGKAPSAHASTSTTYGKGTASNYGHIKLSDTYTTSIGDASSGIAASQKALFDAYSALNSNISWTDYTSLGTVNGVELKYACNGNFCEMYYDGILQDDIEPYVDNFSWGEIKCNPFLNKIIPIVTDQNGLALIYYPSMGHWFLTALQNKIYGRNSGWNTYIAGSFIFRYK